VQPRPGGSTELGDLVERIEGAGVDLARLRADDGGAFGVPQFGFERVGPHSCLGVDVDAPDVTASEAEEAESTVDGHVLAAPGHDADRR
jgi:hypothetical protein